MPEEMLATVRDRLLSREATEAAAPILFPEKDLEDPGTLDGVRGAFSYEQIGTSAFGVSLTAPSSDQAFKSTNALVKAFLESERGQRLRRAQNKLAFHNGELETASDEYTKTLARLDTLRGDNAASLPERKDLMQNELARIATDIAAQNVLIASARTRIQGLDDQLAALDTTSAKGTPQTAGAAEEALRLQLAEAQKALNTANTELAQLRSRYTEEWPDVIRVRAAVEVHKRSVKEAIDALEKVRRQAQGEAGRTAVRLLEARRKNLMGLRQTASGDIEVAERRKTTARERAAELQTHLDHIPTTEALLRPLQRQLEQLGQIVEARRKDAAAAGAAVGFYGSGDVSDVTGYRVDKWATEPTNPTGPVRWRFLATALVVGSLLAYGLILLRRRLESTRVERVEDVADLFPDAVIVGMPDVGGRPHGSKRKFPLGEILAAIYVLGCFTLTGLAIAAQRGWEGAPDWLRALVKA
jgi:uncharacterized protein involved in exopolysaccharide biosynthesis